MNLVGSETKGHYKSQVDLEFLKVVPIKPLQEISQEQINKMLKNIYDVDFWLKMLPPENFEFRGVAMERLIDITEEETLSQMKYKLLEKDAIVRPENVKELERDLKTYFGISDLRMGITAKIILLNLKQLINIKSDMTFYLKTEDVCLSLIHI